MLPNVPPPHGMGCTLPSSQKYPSGHEMGSMVGEVGQYLPVASDVVMSECRASEHVTDSIV